MQPRVLIMCERAAERDTIRVLVGTMGCQWVLASGIEEALSLLGRERTSAVLLELPGTITDSVKLDQGIRELLVRLPATGNSPNHQSGAARSGYFLATFTCGPSLPASGHPSIGLRSSGADRGHRVRTLAQFSSNCADRANPESKCAANSPERCLGCLEGPKRPAGFDDHQRSG